MRIVAVAGRVVVAWACLSSWGAVVHGHPAYAVLLGDGTPKVSHDTARQQIAEATLNFLREVSEG